MTRIAFKKQTGRSSKALEVSSDDDNIRGLLGTLYDESINSGAEIKMTSVTLDEAMFVKKITFGLGEDVTIENIEADYFNLTFFQVGKVYMYLIIDDTNTLSAGAQLSGGTTPGGFELFTSEAITAGGLTAIKIDQTFSVVTPFFLHSGGEGDTWGSTGGPVDDGAILTIKTVSSDV